AIATGHYARIVKRISHNVERKDATRYTLHVSRDEEKDQSYFLWTLSQDVLQSVLFPVGGYRKQEVRALARKFNLPTAEKKDSQGVCFLGKLDMKEFLKELLPAQKGNVVTSAGEVVGEHDGAFLYTLGARHGFAVHPRSCTASPFYVVGRDVLNNTLVVSNRNPTTESTASPMDIELQDVNWVSGQEPAAGSILQGRVRYRQRLFECTVHKGAQGKTIVRFLSETPLAPPGQSLVLYSGDECVGGGVIAGEEEKPLDAARDKKEDGVAMWTETVAERTPTA
ncbi:MAG TPA: tRNA methyl transferase PRC-barrel domain-containing protein, partial [Candidatus Paceibacterota bacterium]